jgi:hypothetical protein
MLSRQEIGHLGLGIERGHKLRLCGARWVCVDVRSLGLGIERSSKNVRLLGAEVSRGLGFIVLHVQEGCQA